MMPLIPARLDHLVLLGAHCDDIVIGAGGSLLRWCRTNPGLRVTALVLTGGGTDREKEERAALAACCPDADPRIDVLDLPDGRVPAHWDRTKDAVEELFRECRASGGAPDLVLAPSRHDAHQDHRTLGRLAPTVFRNHPILGYEILKYDSDLTQPSAFVPLSDDTMTEKVRVLAEHYPSQQDNDWFDGEAFAGLCRVRGVQCHARYAEAFHTDKLALDWDAP